MRHGISLNINFGKLGGNLHKSLNKIIVNDAIMKLSIEEAKRSATTHAEEGFLCSESVLMA